MDNFIGFLQSIRPISKDTAENIVSHFEHKHLPKGALFLKEGQISNEYLFLRSGYMRSFLYDIEGNEKTINFYGPNKPVFEVASFFLRIPSEEYIEAITDVEAYVITFEKLNQLFHSVPEFREIGRAILVNGFVQFKKRTLSLINKTADVRYAELLASQPDLFGYASLKDIASYLGVTDTSLSRIRREYQKR